MAEVAAGDRVLYAPERHEAIVAEAQRQGRVEVSSLAEFFRVAPETIRRDLTALERLGRVRRVHGGALPLAHTGREPTLSERLGSHADVKERIAGRAIQELPTQGTVLLDAGSSTLAIARLLPVDLDIDVVTNSIAIASCLTERSDRTVHLLGGTIRRRTGACVGPWALEALDSISVDVAFIGTNGFTPKRGMTTPDQAEATVKRAMVLCARRAIVVADSSKAGQERLHRFADLDEVDLLITDRDLDEETALVLDEEGMTVTRV